MSINNIMNKYNNREETTSSPYDRVRNRAYKEYGVVLTDELCRLALKDPNLEAGIRLAVDRI